MQVLEAQQGVGVSPVQKWHHQDGWRMQSHHVSLLSGARLASFWPTVPDVSSSPPLTPRPRPSPHPLSPDLSPKWLKGQGKLENLISKDVFRMCRMTMMLAAFRGRSTERFVTLCALCAIYSGQLLDCSQQMVGKGRYTSLIPSGLVSCCSVAVCMKHRQFAQFPMAAAAF